MLNRVLPFDIRVLAWAPVDADFSARFSCAGRVYKYFFLKRCDPACCCVWAGHAIRRCLVSLKSWQAIDSSVFFKGRLWFVLLL